MTQITVTKKILTWPAVGNFPEASAEIEEDLLINLLAANPSGIPLFVGPPSLEDLKRIQVIVTDIIEVLESPQNINTL